VIRIDGIVTGYKNDVAGLVTLLFPVLDTRDYFTIDIAMM
jgi:hypothetical protein